METHPHSPQQADTHCNSKGDLNRVVALVLLHGRALEAEQFIVCPQDRFADAAFDDLPYSLFHIPSFISRGESRGRAVV